MDLQVYHEYLRRHEYLCLSNEKLMGKFTELLAAQKRKDIPIIHEIGQIILWRMNQDPRGNPSRLFFIRATVLAFIEREREPIRSSRVMEVLAGESGITESEIRHVLGVCLSDNILKLGSDRCVSLA